MADELHRVNQRIFAKEEEIAKFKAQITGAGQQASEWEKKAWAALHVALQGQLEALEKQKVILLEAQTRSAAAGPGPGSAETRGRGIISMFEELTMSTLTDRERADLLIMGGVVRALDEGSMDKGVALELLQRLRMAVHTSTKEAIVNMQGYQIDGCLGQGHANLYAAFKGVSVVCAKFFFGLWAAEAMAREKAVSDVVHGAVCCPTLIKVLDCFAVESDKDKRPEAQRFVMILPLLARSAYDLLMCLGGVTDEAAAYIAAGALAGLAGLAMAGHAHNDIKPQHLMFMAGEKRVVLVDLGSATKVNDSPFMVPSVYSLRAQDCAGLRRDLVCLASTLAELGGSFAPDNPSSRHITEDILRDSLLRARQQGIAAPSGGFGLERPLVSDLALDVLEHAQRPDATSVDALRSLFDGVVEHVARLEDAAAAERVRLWWPTMLRT